MEIIISIVTSILFSILVYKNTSGIGVFFFTLIAFAAASYILKLFNKPFKKSSIPYVVCAILLSISTCTTANTTIIALNNLGIILLFFTFLINQMNPVFTLLNVLHSMLNVTFYIEKPFVDIKNELAFIKNEKTDIILKGLCGLVISLPVLAVITALLASADAVFSSIVGSFFKHSVPSSGMVGRFITGLLFFLIFYCAFYSCDNIPALMKRQKQYNNSIGVICALLPITVIYLIFSVIQIAFLFLHGIFSLPVDITYAQYAHEGFYQLLFVALFNLSAVFLLTRLCKKQRFLNFLLAVISLCTCIMILSAGYRIIMYIDAYYLTRLRIMVLWFLLLTLIVMLYVIYYIYHPTFPINRITIITVSVLYLILSFSRMDYIIADYNLTHDTNISCNEAYYLMHSLSCDATPAIMSYEENIDSNELKYYISDINYVYHKTSVLQFNLSKYLAYKAVN